MAGIVTKNFWEITKRQEELLEKYKSPETLRHINQIIGEAASYYVPRSDDPGKSKHMDESWVARSDGIYYYAKYARYQYHGVVYGPNRLQYNVIRNSAGKVISRTPNGFHTPAGTTKYPTNRMIGEVHAFYDKYNLEWVITGYTTPRTTHHWIQRMWKEDRRAVQNRITWYLIGLDKNNGGK
jgi:hypothetical protein